jgi:hypothetical protein
MKGDCQRVAALLITSNVKMKREGRRDKNLFLNIASVGLWSLSALCTAFTVSTGTPVYMCVNGIFIKRTDFKQASS